MSAFMVNDDHLDLLASVAEWGREDLWVYFSDEMLPPRSDLQAERGGNYYRDRFHASLIKEELRLENQASLWARYPNDANEMWAGMEFREYRRIFDDQATTGEVLGALACYEYQACESETWKTSYAFALCQAIRKKICSQLSGSNWEYTRPANLRERVRVI